MSIATRINAIEEHIGNAYNKLDNLGIDSTGVDKNINNIAEMLDTVYEEYPKVTGTGTELTLDGTKVGKLGLDLKGNSTQDGTPSPTNEVPIYSAGDNGSISEKIVNKNLFDITEYPFYSGIAYNEGQLVYWSGYYAINKYFPVLPNTQYTFSNDLNKPIYYGLVYYDKDKNVLSYTSASTTTFTTPNNCSFIRFAIQSTEAPTEIQIEYGSTATTYVSHQEQTYTIPVQQPMRNIGDVKDEFIKVNGNWFERHNIGRYTITGNEAFYKGSDATLIRYEIRGALPLMKQNVARTPCMSNHFYFLSSGSGVGLMFTYWIYSGSMFVYLNQDITTVAGAKEYFQQNETYVDYLLQTPTDLPCTAEQIAILENLPKSYNEQTNVYSLDVTPAYFDASALKA